MPWKRVTLIMETNGTGALCQLPYPGHPKGCPNYGKRSTCPPRAKVWSKSYLEGKVAWVVWMRFAFDRHVRRMHNRHPEWTKRQCECCLYWQGGLRRRLREEVRRFKLHLLRENGSFPLHVEYIPEAHGVNVSATMMAAPIVLEWPPKTDVYKVAVVLGRGQ